MGIIEDSEECDNWLDDQAEYQEDIVSIESSLID